MGSEMCIRDRLGEVLQRRNASSTNALTELLQHHLCIAQQVPQAKIAHALTQLWIVLNSGDDAAIRHVAPARADLRRGLREACARVQRSCAVQWVAHAVKGSIAVCERDSDPG